MSGRVEVYEGDDEFVEDLRAVCADDDVEVLDVRLGGSSRRATFWRGVVAGLVVAGLAGALLTRAAVDIFIVFFGR